MVIDFNLHPSILPDLPFLCKRSHIFEFFTEFDFLKDLAVNSLRALTHCDFSFFEKSCRYSIIKVGVNKWKKITLVLALILL